MSPQEINLATVIATRFAETTINAKNAYDAITNLMHHIPSDLMTAEQKKVLQAAARVANDIRLDTNERAAFNHAQREIEKANEETQAQIAIGEVRAEIARLIKEKGFSNQEAMDYLLYDKN